MTTPTTQREADERTLFESDLRAEAHEAGGTPDIEAHVAEMLQRAPNGDYATLWVHFRWEGWQRALAVREAMPASLPRAIGVSRDAESPGGKGILIFFKRPLCDGELRALHSALARQAAPEAPAAATDQPSAGQVDERTLFESYMVDRHGPCVDLTRTGEAEKGEYRNESVDNVREGWIAGRASLTPTSPNLSEADIKWILSCRGMRNVAERAYQLGLSRATPTAPQAATTASAVASQAADDEQASLERFAKDIRHHILHQAYTWLPAKHAKTMENMVGGMSLRAIVDAYAPVQAAQPAPKLLGQVVMYPNYSTVIQWVEGVTPPAGTKLYEIPDAAPGAAQTTDARDAALEEAAQLCDSLGGDIDERNVDEVKLCANSLAWSIRRLKSGRATHPTDKGQTNE